MCLPQFKLCVSRDTGSFLHLFKLLHTSFVFACLSVFVCACMYVYMYVCAWIFGSVCVRVCLCVFTCVQVVAISNWNKVHVPTNVLLFVQVLELLPEEKQWLEEWIQNHKLWTMCCYYVLLLCTWWHVPVVILCRHFVYVPTYVYVQCTDGGSLYNMYCTELAIA